VIKTTIAIVMSSFQRMAIKVSFKTRMVPSILSYTSLYS
jgi:hypothetical protein